MDLTAAFTIGVRKRVNGATDAHGNPVVTYSDPISVPVYSIAPAYSNEPYEAGREAVVTGLTVLAPSEAATKVGEDDIVVVDNEDYTVEGEIADWNRGPFGWTPGIQITLKRVEG